MLGRKVLLSSTSPNIKTESKGYNIALVKTYNPKKQRYEKAQATAPLSLQSQVVLLQAKLDACYHAPDLTVVKNIVKGSPFTS